MKYELRTDRVYFWSFLRSKMFEVGSKFSGGDPFHEFVRTDVGALQRSLTVLDTSRNDSLSASTCFPFLIS